MLRKIKRAPNCTNYFLTVPYDFYNSIFPGKCSSAQGKSNLESHLQHLAEPGKVLLAIVDGAAFGPEMRSVMRLVKFSLAQIALYAPESFECILLQSGILASIPKTIWEETWEHADSVLFFSWEEFYTAYLSERTRNTVYQYSKRQLNENWLTEGNVKRILAVLPEAITEGIGDR